jgi:hypothetical protein
MAGLLRKSHPTLELIIAIVVIGAGVIIGAWAVAAPIARYLGL